MNKLMIKEDVFYLFILEALSSVASQGSSNLSLSTPATRLIQLRLAAPEKKSGMVYFWLVLSFLPSHSGRDPYNQDSINIFDDESKSFVQYKHNRMQI